MVNKKEAIRRALKSCGKKKGKEFDSCLLREGFVLKRIPKMEVSKMKIKDIKIEEFDNIQNALKKLRRLRGL